jgi:UDP-N-acetyl-D-glucosamine dehydrogenase
MKIAVIGLGYVGLPLSLQFARSCTDVISIDVDPKKVELLNNGQSYIKHIQSAEIAELVAAGKFLAFTNFSQIKDVEAAIIWVPTPLNKNREPDLSYVLQTGRSIAPHLQQGTLVVLESTTYPGTTEQDLRAILEENSCLKLESCTCNSGKRRNARWYRLSFGFLARVPAIKMLRLTPSPKSLEVIPKIVLIGPWRSMAGRLTELYRSLPAVPRKRQSCLKTSSAAGNIALVNELKVVYDAMDIDIWEVIEAAKTKPFGFMPFYPGPGLGGIASRSIRSISRGKRGNTVSIPASLNWPARSTPHAGSRGASRGRCAQCPTTTDKRFQNSHSRASIQAECE